jgi:hypothetical protein
VSAATALARGRAAAQALMVDACTVKRKTGEATDRDSGQTTPTWTTLYTGACRVQQSQLGAASTPADPGEAAVRLVAYELQLPVAGTAGIREGDVATITASALDADLVGRVFTVTGTAHATHKTARRLQVQEVAT